MTKQTRPTSERATLWALAFGAHADDTDIGCSGTLAAYAQRGFAVGVCDLTHAELSSNGTMYTRQAEAQAAAAELKLTVRETLSFPDRGLSVHSDAIQQVAEVIRRYRPTIVLVPDWEDRHPDHRACAAIVEEAVFSAGLRRYGSPNGYEPHKVNQVFYYFINGIARPDITVDITEVLPQKRAALAAYGTQFQTSHAAVSTPLNQGFLAAIEGRDALVGHQVGLRYAEGFRTKRPLVLDLATL